MSVKSLPFLLWLIMVALGLLTGCSPFNPEHLEQMRAREAYVELIRAHLSHEEVFYFDSAGESLFLKAVYVTPELLAAARSRWSNDPVFSEALKRWHTSDGAQFLVLLGLYRRGFESDDLLKTGSFRVALQSTQPIKPTLIEEVKADFLADYFPVFDIWEKVFMLRFPAVKGTSEPLPKPVLEVDWPAGHQTLLLTIPESEVVGLLP